MSDFLPTILVPFLRYEKKKSVCVLFFFLNKRKMSYPALLLSGACALSASGVFYTGWHLDLLLDLEMLSALGCAERSHSSKIVNFLCVHL